MNLRPYSSVCMTWEKKLISTTDVCLVCSVKTRPIPRPHSAFRCPFGWLGSAIIDIEIMKNRQRRYTKQGSQEGFQIQLGPIWKLAHLSLTWKLRNVAPASEQRLTYITSPYRSSDSEWRWTQWYAWPFQCCHQNGTSSTPTRPSKRLQKCTDGRPRKDGEAPNKRKIDNEVTIPFCLITKKYVTACWVLSPQSCNLWMQTSTNKV